LGAPQAIPNIIDDKGKKKMQTVQESVTEKKENMKVGGLEQDPWSKRGLESVKIGA